MELRLLPVPAGRVTLSDRRARTSWTEDVTAFAIAEHLVAVALYTRVAGGPDARRPVTDTSWFDALGFCNALSVRHGLRPAYAVDGEDVTGDHSADGFRLPTDAEWAHACRAGTDGPRYGPLDDVGFRLARTL